MESLRIVFMGTPGFAVGILDAILENKYNVVGVVTAPDKPAGRGQKVQRSAVKEFALGKGLPVLQPVNLKSPEFLDELRALNANLQVVVAFRMLPEAVWKMPGLGTFNLHASLLPDYRGAAPINWAIINGEEKTGVTTFFIDDKIDTGAMILRRETGIGPNETAGELHDRLMALGREAVADTLQRIARDSFDTTLQPQDAGLKTAYKLNRENTKIDWLQPGKKIHDLVRGLSPYPVAWTDFHDGDATWAARIYEARFEPAIHDERVGKIMTGKREMKAAVRDGYVHLLWVQFPGKKKMAAGEFLNGYKPSANAYVS
jgi:methionyl-tRNA formyltransferase